MKIYQQAGIFKENKTHVLVNNDLLKLTITLYFKYNVFLNINKTAYAFSQYCTN